MVKTVSSVTEGIKILEKKIGREFSIWLITITKMYQVNMLYNQFKEFFLDGFHTHKYDKYVEDGTITIDYTYLPSKNGKTYIKFNIPETDIGMTISYGGSSQFAMWWCQLTDGLEDDDDTPLCDDYNNTIVSGIVCKKCNNELPPMTMQEHLDGDFNKDCPHDDADKDA